MIYPLKALTFIVIISLSFTSVSFGDSLRSNNNENSKVAYLTFDDGPSNFTEEILEILKEKGVLGTFFITGKSTKDYESVLVKILEEGHVIGNHSYSHNYAYIYKNADNFFQDFYRNEELIYRITGVRPRLMRFPGGSNNKSSRIYGKKYLMNEICAEIEKKGYSYFDWNVSSRDADGNDYTVDEIVRTTLYQAKHKKDAVILLHDTASKWKTVQALPKIIDGLQEQGFVFATLEDISVKVAFPLPKVKIVPKRKILTPQQKWKLARLEELHKK